MEGISRLRQLSEHKIKVYCGYQYNEKYIYNTHLIAIFPDGTMECGSSTNETGNFARTSKTRKQMLNILQKDGIDISRIVK